MLTSLAVPRRYGSIIDPKDLYCCRLALDMSAESYANGAQITSVTDRSGHGLTFTNPGTANLVYETNVLNGLGVADFKGTDSYLVAAAAADWTWMKAGGAFHIIVLFYATEANPNKLQAILDNCAVNSANHGISFTYDDRQASSIFNRLNGVIGSGGSLVSGTAPNYALQPQVWSWAEMLWQGRLRGGLNHGDIKSALGLYVNGLSNSAIVSTATAPNATVASAALNIGRTKDSTFFGTFKIGCVYIFDRILDTDTHDAVMLHLSRKWKVGYNRVVSKDEYSANSGYIRRPDKTFALAYVHKSSHVIVKNTQQLLLKRSPDGWHWNTGPEDLILSYPTDKGIQAGGMLGQLSTGTMLCGGFSSDGVADNDAMIQRSTDGGRTWSAATVTTGFTTWSALQSPFLELTPGGTILAVVYGLDSGGGQITYNKILRSTDDGVTWTILSTLHTGNGGDAKAVNEGCIVKRANGNLFACFRNETDFTFNYKISTDNGATWGARTAMLATASAGPFILQAASGNWFVFCRTSVAPNRGLIYWSADEGATWSTTPYWISAVNGFSHYAAGFEVEPGIFDIFNISQWDDNSTFTVPNTATGYVGRHREADIILHT